MSSIVWTPRQTPSGRPSYYWLSDTVPCEVPTEQCGEILIGLEVYYGQCGDGRWAVEFCLDTDSRRSFAPTEADARERAEALVRAFQLVWREDLAAQAEWPIETDGEEK